MLRFPDRSVDCAAVALMAGLVAAVAGAEVPLVQLARDVYQTEHCLFLVDRKGEFGFPSYDAVLSEERRPLYVEALRDWFPADYFSITLVTNNLEPPFVPRYLFYRHKALGIGTDGGGAEGVADQCLHNGLNPRGNFASLGTLGVWDHEIGHAWSMIFFGPDGHYPSNSTVRGQMAGYSSQDGYRTGLMISGNEEDGFTWEAVPLAREQKRQRFSKQHLYVMGLEKRFPTSWVLNDPVYNADGTMSYSSLERHDHRSTLATYGPRIPSYKESQKRFRIGFVYLVRDEEELLQSYEGIEQSIEFVCNATRIHPFHPVTVPFLVETHLRASLDCRLSDLDGNTAPELRIAERHRQRTIRQGETAQIDYLVIDPDGRPRVACIEDGGACDVREDRILVSGLRPGAHFFTVQAKDEGGKTTYDHFVVDVKR
jgi:hypothetical protein